MFGIPNVFGLKGFLIGCGVSVALGAAAGGYIGFKVEQGTYERHLRLDAEATTKAVTAALEKQRRINALNQADAVEAAYFRGKMDGTTVQLKSGVPLNVTVSQDQSAALSDRAGCVTFGFARLLYAGAHGVDPESLSLPSGESVDTCTDLKPSELASAVAQDLAAGYSNGHNLDQLIAAVKRNNAVAEAP